MKLLDIYIVFIVIGTWNERMSLCIQGTQKGCEHFENNLGELQNSKNHTISLFFQTF